MRMISIFDYDEQKMQLAKPVFDNHRRILLAENQTIHPKYLEKLIQIGVRNLIVEDAESKGISLEEMIDVPSWLDIVSLVQQAFEAAALKKPVPIKPLLQGAGRLIMEIQRRNLILPVPSTTLAENLKPYAHSVNVAILSLQVGKILGYNELMLRDLAMGCLLHDIGKVVSKEEKGHPEAGFSLLRNIREISLLSAHIAFQHHESLDGTGYPRSISGQAFHEYAQICGLCNMYEHRIAINPPHEVMEMVMTLSGIAYSTEVLQAFVRAVPAYPPGTKILLREGKEAIVTKITSHLQRPVVRCLSTGEEISLAEQPTVMIVGCI